MCKPGAFHRVRRRGYLQIDKFSTTNVMAQQAEIWDSSFWAYSCDSLLYGNRLSLTIYKQNFYPEIRLVIFRPAAEVAIAVDG